MYIDYAKKLQGSDVYAINGTTFALVLMVVIGITDYFLRKFEVPMAPLVLGGFLGDMMKQNLRLALSMTNGNIGILFESKLSIGLWIATALVGMIPPLMRKMRKKVVTVPAN